MGFCLFVCECVGEDETVTCFCNHWYQVEVSCSLCFILCVCFVCISASGNCTDSWVSETLSPVWGLGF